MKVFIKTLMLLLVSTSAYAGDYQITRERLYVETDAERFPQVETAWLRCLKKSEDILCNWVGSIQQDLLKNFRNGTDRQKYSVNELLNRATKACAYSLLSRKEAPKGNGYAVMFQDLKLEYGTGVVKGTDVFLSQLLTCRSIFSDYTTLKILLGK